MCLACFGSEMKNGNGTGGFWCVKDGLASGFGEWNFSLHNDKDGFVLRDCIDIGGFGGTRDDYSGAILGNKFIIGGRYDAECFVFRSYGFLGAGFGIFRTEGHEFYDNPYLVSTVFGGGTEFQYSKDSAFVIEFGGSMDFFVGERRNEFSKNPKGGPILVLGFRSYF